MLVAVEVESTYASRFASVPDAVAVVRNASAVPGEFWSTPVYSVWSPSSNPPLVALRTVTWTCADVTGLLAASRTRAVRMCAPSAAVAVFHETDHGDIVSSTPRFAPSRRNWTATAGPVVVAVTVAGPETVELSPGALT